MKMLHSYFGEFDWNDSLQGDLIGSFFYGYLITQIPGGVLADLWGAKQIFGGTVLLTSVCSVLSPVSARLSPYLLIAVRVIMGLVQGPLFGSVTAIVAKWAPSNERSVLNNITNAGVPLGVFLGNIVSGKLLEIFPKWDYVFYVYAFVGVLWYVIWQVLSYGEPDKHPFMKDSEREYINSSIHEDSQKPAGGVPWMDIIKCPHIYFISITNLGSDFGFYVIVTELPLYLANVLQFRIFTTGIVSAIPWLFMWAGTLTLGALADLFIIKGWLSKVIVRKISGFLANGLPAVFIISASYSGCNRAAVTIFLTVSMFFFGACYSSFRLSTMDISPNWAGTIMAIVNCVGVTAGFGVPKLAHSLITDGGTLQEWRVTFWITFVVLIVSLIPYFFVTAKVQPWNEGKIKKENA